MIYVTLSQPSNFIPDFLATTLLLNGLGIKDTSLPLTVKHAFHACALHENRSRFDVTPLKAKVKDVNDMVHELKQVSYLFINGASV